MTRSELERARQRADDVGREGEEFVYGYFELQLLSAQIACFTWVSAENAISPYDFTTETIGRGTRKIEVKSTHGDFGQTLHLSLAQLFEMRDSEEEYDLFRIYALDDRTAKLRIANDTRTFASSLLDQFAGLPAGTTVDGISVNPNTLPFGEEIVISLPEKWHNEELA